MFTRMLEFVSMAALVLVAAPVLAQTAPAAYTMGQGGPAYAMPQAGPAFEPVASSGYAGAGLAYDDPAVVYPGVVVGFQATFLKPYWRNNPAMMELDAVGPPNGSGTNIPFDYKYEFSPRLWVGYVGASGLGFRGRYFSFDHTQSQTATDTAATWFVPGDSVIPPYGVDSIDPIVPVFGGFRTYGFDFPAAGDVVSVSNHLKLYTIDGEVTDQVQLGRWQSTFGGGVRGGSIHQDTAVVITRGADTATSNFNAHFDGIGPTVFAEMKRPLGFLGLAVVGNLRGSLLFGSSAYHSDLTSTAGFIGGFAASFDSVAQGSLAIGEFQMGLEWTHLIASGTNLCAQALWEGQLWAGAGNAWTTSYDDLGLQGIVFSVGITR